MLIVWSLLAAAASPTVVFEPAHPQPGDRVACRVVSPVPGPHEVALSRDGVRAPPRLELARSVIAKPRARVGETWTCTARPRHGGETVQQSVTVARPTTADVHLSLPYGTAPPHTEGDDVAALDGPCALYPDGRVACPFGPRPPEGLRGVEVAGSPMGACVVTDDRRVTCYSGLRPPDDRPADHVRAGMGTVCVWVDGEDARCNVAAAPRAPFDDLVVSAYQACALRGGALRCGEDVVLEGITEAFASPWGATVCGLAPDRSAVCRFGDEVQRQPGPFRDVAVGRQVACGLREGEVLCWDAEGDASAPPTRQPVREVHLAIDAGRQCRLTDGHHVRCTLTEAPPRVDDDPFVELVVGTRACVRRRSGAVVCGKDAAPGPEVRGLSMADSLACGLDARDRPRCWGHPDDLSLPDEAVRAVVSDGDQAFVLHADHTVGAYGYRATRPLGDTFVVGVDAFDGHVCGLTAAGEAVCAHRDERRELATPAAGPFTTVAVGRLHACGLRPSGEVACWGRDDWGQLRVPPPGDDGPWIRLTAARDTTCALAERADRWRCFGALGGDSGWAHPKATRVVAVDGGGGRTCLTDDGGRVRCVTTAAARRPGGPEVYEMGILPGEGVEQLAVHGDTLCALLDDGGVTCHGTGGAPAPGGRFTQLAAGAGVACGLHVTGRVECWGSGAGPDDAPGWPRPPAELATDVDVGATETCAVFDGIARCWGPDGERVLGPATAVAVDEQACWLTPDRGLRCDGDLHARGAWVDLVVDGTRACVRSDAGMVSCFPRLVGGGLNTGPMDRVSLSEGMACGLVDGDVGCWGAGSALRRQPTP